MKDYILGIDTSNYTTSVALINSNGEIISDERIVLDVKAGERGLRQSEALFKHTQNLNILFNKVFSHTERPNLKAIGVSTRPRNIEGSYMPVFLAGYNVAKCLGETLKIPVYEFSHQEGHIEAIKAFTNMKNKNDFICFHLSGGTTEILRVRNGEVEIIGGTLDISFGQLIDRIGVKLGKSFPAGRELDEIALNSIEQNINLITKIKINNLKFNLSGIETGLNRLIGSVSNEMVVFEMFNKISICLKELCVKCRDEYKDVSDIIFAGGVSESRFIRSQIKNALYGNYGADNAVGVALLGGNEIWQLNQLKLDKSIAT
ncbi:MAG: O-sialoglycoprotein endopeptidase [Anaerovoracaceae bacterium]